MLSFSLGLITDCKLSIFILSLRGAKRRGYDKLGVILAGTATTERSPPFFRFLSCVFCAFCGYLNSAIFNRKMNKPLKEQLKRIGGMKLNEEIIEVERIHDMESHIFDVIIQFKKTFEKSEWKKNRKISSLIKKMIDLEAKLGNETLELE